MTHNMIRIVLSKRVDDHVHGLDHFITSQVESIHGTHITSPDRVNAYYYDDTHHNAQ